MVLLLQRRDFLDGFLAFPGGDGGDFTVLCLHSCRSEHRTAHCRTGPGQPGALKESAAVQCRSMIVGGCLTGREIFGIVGVHYGDGFVSGTRLGP